MRTKLWEPRRLLFFCISIYQLRSKLAKIRVRETIHRLWKSMCINRFSKQKIIISKREETKPLIDKNINQRKRQSSKRNVKNKEK